jgi:hypothetical protein
MGLCNVFQLVRVMNLHIQFSICDELEKLFDVVFKLFASDDVVEQRWAEQLCILSRQTSGQELALYGEDDL